MDRALCSGRVGGAEGEENQKQEQEFLFARKCHGVWEPGPILFVQVRLPVFRLAQVALVHGFILKVGPLCSHSRTMQPITICGPAILVQGHNKRCKSLGEREMKKSAKERTPLHQSNLEGTDPSCLLWPLLIKGRQLSPQSCISVCWRLELSSHVSCC